MAEQLMYGTSDIPSVGKVEFSWVPNPPVNTTTTPTPSSETQNQRDEDTAMGGATATAGEGEQDPLAMRKDGNNMNHEVDYDVAEVDDGWGIE